MSRKEQKGKKQQLPQPTQPSNQKTLANQSTSKPPKSHKVPESQATSPQDLIPLDPDLLENVSLLRAVPTPGNSPFAWPGADDRVTVEDMLRDPLSENWYECREFVRKQVQTGASNVAQEERDDIVQDVMGRVYRALPNFRFGSKLSTWIFRILQNSIQSFYQVNKSSLQLSVSPDASFDVAECEPNFLLPDTPPSIGEYCIINDELKIGLEAIEEYIVTHPNSQRNSKIVEIVILKNQTLGDAAKAVGCSPAVAGYVVRQAHRYAREKRDQKG